MSNKFKRVEAKINVLYWDTSDIDEFSNFRKWATNKDAAESYSWTQDDSSSKYIIKGSTADLKDLEYTSKEGLVLSVTCKKIKLCLRNEFIY